MPCEKNQFEASFPFDPSLMLVTDHRLMAPWGGVEEVLAAAARGGATMVQIREKDLSAKDFYREAMKLKSLAQGLGLPAIVNDRVDIALAVGALGVHVGQEDLPAEEARKLMGPDKIMGVSVSSLEQALEAEKAGADYLGLGAMFATATKPEADGVPISEISRIKARVKLPLVVIGGIRRDRLSAFKEHKSDGLAVVSGVLGEDVRLETERLLAAFRAL